MTKMEDLIRIGIDAGFVTNVHAIGDKGVAPILDTYEKLMRQTGRTPEGFRVIHAQVIRQEDFPRFTNLHVIAEESKCKGFHVAAGFSLHRACRL